MEPEVLTLPPPPFFKKTEIKSLLTERMKREHPSFRFLTYATGVFHFQRMKEFRGYDLKEALHLVFSISECSMHASISSRLNPVHTLTPVYNAGFINPHVDLLAIRNSPNVFPTSDTAYQSDGTPDGTVAMIDQLIHDFGNTGIPYFETRWTNLHNNTLVNTGIDIIESWDLDKTMLRNELNVQLRKAKLVINNLRHPLCKQLRADLRNIPGQSPEACKEIPRLAFELMELYCNSHIIS